MFDNQGPMHKLHINLFKTKTTIFNDKSYTKFVTNIEKPD